MAAVDSRADQAVVDCRQHVSLLSNSSSQCITLLISGQVHIVVSTGAPHVALHSLGKHGRPARCFKGILVRGKNSNFGGDGCSDGLQAMSLSPMRSTSSDEL